MFRKVLIVSMLLVCVALVQAHNTLGGIPKDCPKPNEHYECTSSCESRCSTLGEPCRLRFIRCNDVCYCDEGFARNRGDDCIPISQCPSKK